MLSRYSGTLLLHLAFFFCTVSAVHAGSVALDETFGVDGISFTKLGYKLDTAQAIALQPDSKVVVAGSSDNGLGSNVAVVRYLPDGTLDHEFLFSSGASLGSAYGNDSANSVIVNSDGTILLGGSIAGDAFSAGAVIRLLANGQLDATFGDQGVAFVGPEPFESAVTDIAVDQSGRIVVTGYATTESGEYPLVARFTGSGERDNAFAAEGAEIVDSVEGRASALEILADDTLVISGYTLDGEGRRGVYLGKYLPDGEPDVRFGNQGSYVWFNQDEEVLIHDTTQQSDGMIIAAGEVVLENGEHRILLARFDTGGAPDEQFGENGLLVYDTGLDSGVHSVTILNDDTILAAGYQSRNSGKDLVLIRYQPRNTVPSLSEDSDSGSKPAMNAEDGEPIEIIKIAALDVEDGPMDIPVAAQSVPHYEADLITTELPGSDEVSNAVTVDETGNVYSAGSSGTDDNTMFMVARYSGVSGKSYPVGSTAATQSQYYSIATMPVTDITRVGALTGGNIVSLESGTENCLEECELSCEDSGTDVDTCKDECPATCVSITVTQRGVVYSVDPSPEYDPEDDGTGSGSGDTGVDSGGDASTLPSGSTSDSGSSVGSFNLFDFDSYFVLGGQTTDGSGEGSYTSDIEDVNPQTVYYVRAYALLSDGTVIYGNEYQFKTNDSCFIATAAFGSLDTFAVEVLRDFRDRYLLNHEWGQRFITLYYSLSPSLASFIERVWLLRFLVIFCLLPAVSFALFLLYGGLILNTVLVLSAGIWSLGKLRK